MSDENLPAVPEAQAPREIATLDTDSWVQVARPIFELASRVYDTDFVPRGLRGSEAATAAAMMYGREVGLPPMTALNVTHVIEGKPGLSAEAMRAMVYAAGHELEVVESTGAMCTLRGRRRGQERWTSVTWSIDMAKAAGIAQKAIWKNYPRTQLQARATTELCRLIFPDVIHGFRSVEELEDMSEGDEGPTSTPTTTVQRVQPKKRAAAKKAATPAPEPAALPPLPGEEGFEQPAEQPSAGASDDADPASHAEDGGHDHEDAPVDAETVEESADTETSTPTAGVASAAEHGPRGLVPSQDGEPVGVEQAPEPDEPLEVGPDDAPKAGGPKMSGAQKSMLFGTLSRLDVDADPAEERHLIVGIILGREIGSFNELSKDEASTVIDTLARIKDKAALNNLLDRLEAQRREQS